MAWNSKWRVFIGSDKEAGARRVFEKVIAALAVEPGAHSLEPYRLGGHVAAFHIKHPPLSWAETVVDVLALAQRLGRGWRIYGEIQHAPSGWLATEKTGDSHVAGVTAAEWQLLRGDAGEPATIAGR